MDKSVYNIINTSEDGWWYYGRSCVVKEMLSHTLPLKLPIEILDYGAGFGAMLSVLNGYGNVDAFEIEKECVVACEKKGYRRVMADINELVNNTRHYNIIGLFDVLEHVKDDVALLHTLRQIMAVNGLLVLTVPAHQFLFGPYDKEAHHYRRYSKKDLCAKLINSGFNIEHVSYWNTSLFPLFVVARLIKLRGGNMLQPHTFINTILKTIMRIESRVMRYAMLPFGLSLVVIARSNKR